MAKKLVIVGGHASLPVIKMGKKWKSYDLAIVLISENSNLIYSGALPQFMGGFYEWYQTAVNLEDLCDRYGVKFIESRIESISRNQSMVSTSDGKQYLYDYLLINLGAITAKFKNLQNAIPVKPMNELLSLRSKLKHGEVKKATDSGRGSSWYRTCSESVTSSVVCISGNNYS